jgi:hypothetical protein
MLARFARVALFIALGVLAWNLFAKPATRKRVRGYVEVLAFALLASSALLIGWHWLYG